MRAPTAGNWTVIAFVYDSYLAKIRAQTHVYVNPVALTADIEVAVFSDLDRNQDLQDTSGTLQQVGALALTMNTDPVQATRRRL